MCGCRVHESEALDPLWHKPAKHRRIPECVRRVKLERPSRAQHPGDFSELLLRVAQMLDHHIGRHEIERAVGKRQSADVAADEPSHAAVVLQRREIVVDAGHRTTRADELALVAPAVEQSERPSRRS